MNLNRAVIGTVALWTLVADPRQSSQQLRLHGRRARVRRRGLACRDVLQELRRRQDLARWNDQRDSCRQDPVDGSVGRDLARALSEQNV